MSDLPEWAQELPETLHDAPYLADSESPEAWLNEIKHLSTWKGNSIRIPGPDSSDEDKATFKARAAEKIDGLYALPGEDDAEGLDAIMVKLGKPQDAANYSLPEGLDIDGEALGQFKAQAHQLNMTQGQFAQWMQGLNEQNETQALALETAKAEQKTLLEGEWGPAYAERYKVVEGFIGAAGVPGYLKDGFANGTLTAAEMNWAYQQAMMGEESSQAELQKDGGSRQLDAAEAEAQLAEIEKRLFAKDMVRGSDEQRVLADKRLKLIKLLHGVDTAA